MDLIKLTINQFNVFIDKCYRFVLVICGRLVFIIILHVPIYDPHYKVMLSNFLDTLYDTNDTSTTGIMG